MGSIRPSRNRAVARAVALFSLFAVALVGCVSITPSASTGASPDASAAASSALNPEATPAPGKTPRKCQPADTRPRCQSPSPAASETTTATEAPTDSPAPTDPPTAEPTAVPPGISLAPTTLDFGSVFVGSTASIAVVVTNGGPGAVTPNWSGGAPNDPTNFGGSQNCAGVPLPELGTCEFTYTFEPSAPGPWTSSTTIGADATNFSITMSGVGVSPISLAPTTLNFGLVTVGTTAEIDVVVTNGGPDPVTPNYAGGAPIDPTHFGGSQNCAGVTLPAAGTCEFTYTFSPTATGPWSTTTTIDVDGTAYPIAMSGCGTDGISIPPDCVGGIQN